MAGISSKALVFGEPENKKKYNGIEKENDLQIEIYDAQLRELDAQVGRWWQVDSKTENMEMWSPYASNYDNPILYSDPLGDEGKVCCGGILKAVSDYVLGTTIGTAAGITDNLTGTNIRGELSKSFEGGGAAAMGWNMGLGLADAAGTVIGIGEMITGGAGAVGSLLAIPGTAGTSSGALTGSMALATHGVFTTSNSINNLFNQNGRVDASSSSSGGGSPATGKSDNKLKPDQDAQGSDHLTFQRDDNGNIFKYEEWKPNPQNPSGYDSKKRFDGGQPNGQPGTPHYDKKTKTYIPTPHVNEKKNVRTPTNDELPNNNRFKPQP